MRHSDDPNGTWPYSVMLDLVKHLRQKGLSKTAESLDDVALLFLEERQSFAHVSADNSRPNLRVIENS